MEPTACEKAQHACAMRHVQETYKVPHYAASYLALHLLAAGWLPSCAHERRHHFSNYKRHGRNRPMPWYVKTEPDEMDSILFVGSWQPFVAMHWGA